MVGCNIDISKITDVGKVFIVKNSKTVDRDIVKYSFSKTISLRSKSAESKGWILDIMKCVDSIQKDLFSLDDIYKFEVKLKQKYPNNNFIKDKIRQQLRDKGKLNLSEGEIIKKSVYENIQYCN